MKRLPAFALALMAVSPCLAHKDRIFTLGKDGQVIGLPPQYSPASLHIGFSRSDPRGVSITHIELKVADNTVVVPVCVTGLLLTRSHKDVRVTGTTTPHYLAVEFFDPGREGADFRPGYSLHFDLSTARMRSMHIDVLRDGGKSIQTIPVDFTARCTAAELATFAADAPPAR